MIGGWKGMEELACTEVGDAAAGDDALALGAAHAV